MGGLPHRGDALPLGWRASIAAMRIMLNGRWGDGA
jgi:hypothetical protein